MDEAVLDAITKWPDVPAVYGWLSLTARGQWRLHPQGDAIDGGPGESITNEQILSFIARNYDCDDAKQWFFQNGPQRVYVRLDAAPLIISVDDAHGVLSTHIGTDIAHIFGWFIDEHGQLFARTEQGPGLILDKDLPRLVEDLQNEQGLSLAQWWAETSETETTLSDVTKRFSCCQTPAKLARIKSDTSAATALGFCANPGA